MIKVSCQLLLCCPFEITRILVLIVCVSRKYLSYNIALCTQKVTILFIFLFSFLIDFHLLMVYDNIAEFGCRFGGRLNKYV